MSAAFGDVPDRHLSTRPADWLTCVRYLLAIRGEYHWAHVREGFEDDILRLDCPHCGTEPTCATGRFGRYVPAWDGDREHRTAPRCARPRPAS
ncbi:hypothetical protein ACQYWQ_23830 [Streptomyces sp. P6-2-1]|uniref:hypothetical protein n=1 Tax=unclassified Streptomyces TaxID=2593676 RepID=UPI003D36E0F3